MFKNLYRKISEKRLAIVVVYALLFLVIISLFLESPEKEQVTALKGEITLPEGKNVFKLDGIWEFYPNSILSANDFKERSDLKPYYIKVPSNWHGFSYDNGKKMSLGSATYRLKVKIPKDFKGQQLAILVSNIKSSYSIFVDDRLITSAGRPAMTEAEWLMGHYPQIGFFETDKEIIEVIIQVSNFTQANSSGIVLPVRIGSAAELLRIMDLRFLNANVSIAIALFSFLVCLGLFLQYKHQKELFFLMLFCLSVTLFLFFQRTNLVFWFFPNFPKDLWLRLAHITAIFTVTSMVFYVWEAFGRVYLRKLFYGIHLLNLFSLILLLALPVKVITQYEYLVFVRDGIASFFILTTVFRRGSLEGYESRFLAFGLLWYPIVSIAVVAVNYLPTNYYLPFSIPFMILMTTQLLFISARYKTRQMNEKIKAERLKINYLLLRSQINPHFMHNVLNTITALTLTDPVRARELISKFSQFIRMSDRFTNNKILVTLEEEIKNIECYLFIEKARFGEKISFKNQIAEKFFNILVPPLSLLTIVENAVLHGISKKIDAGKIILKILENEQAIIIVVGNDGKALPEDIKISDLIKQNPKSIGLKNTKQRLESLLGAKLYLGNTENWTEFIVEIPKRLLKQYKIIYDINNDFNLEKE